MSFGSLLRKIVGSPAGASVIAFAGTEADKAVVALRNTAIGAAVANDIVSLTDARLSGAEKFEQVVTNTAPLIVAMLTKAGRSATLTDVSDVTRALVQSTFNDVQSTKAATIGSMILSILGVK